MKILRLALSVGLLIATAKADVLSMLSARPSPVDSIFWDAQGVSELDEIASGSTTNGNGFVIAGNRTFLFMGSTFNADFLPTDGVLTTFDPNNGAPAGGFRITFDQPIYGGGAQIQIPSFGVPFVAQVEAFGAGGISFGTVSRTGSVNDPSQGDGSALFLGVRSDLQDIIALEFRTTDEQGGSIDGLGVNNVSIVGASAVPEPAGLAAPALAGLIFAAWRRRHSAGRLRSDSNQR